MAVEFGEVGFAIIQVRVLRIVLYLATNTNNKLKKPRRTPKWKFFNVLVQVFLCFGCYL